MSQWWQAWEQHPLRVHGLECEDREWAAVGVSPLRITQVDSHTVEQEVASILWEPLVAALGGGGGSSRHAEARLLFGGLVYAATWHQHGTSYGGKLHGIRFPPQGGCSAGSTVDTHTHTHTQWGGTHDGGGDGDESGPDPCSG